MLYHVFLCIVLLLTLGANHLVLIKPSVSGKSPPQVNNFYYYYYYCYYYTIWMSLVAGLFCLVLLLNQR